MALWWKFQGPDFAENITRNIHGEQVSVLPSPYDIPELFRTYADPVENRWIVEFRYIDSEPLMVWQPSETVRFWLGRNSRRVYKIEARHVSNASEDPYARAQIVRCLDDALKQLERNTNLGTAPVNYEFLRRGIPQTAIFQSSSAH